jgi:hypothetical protein
MAELINRYRDHMDHQAQIFDFCTSIKISILRPRGSLLPFTAWGTGNASFSFFPLTVLLLINFTVTSKKKFFLMSWSKVNKDCPNIDYLING